MVTRIHLKTACANRKELVDFCLGYDEKYLVIGWSHIYEENQIQDYNSYYETVKKAVKSDGKRLNPALNIFRKTKKSTGNTAEIFFCRYHYRLILNTFGRGI